MGTYSSALRATANAADITGATDTYATPSLLPLSGVTAGSQAYVSSTNRLYIFTGTGWYSIALVNNNPVISSILTSNDSSSPIALKTSGNNTIVTVNAVDSEGIPLTYSYVTDSGFDGLATISAQDSSVFTITPFSSDSATTTSGIVTFKASDGINVTTTNTTFTLSFLTLIDADMVQGSWGKQSYAAHSFSGTEVYVTHSQNFNTNSHREFTGLTIGQTYQLDYEHKSATSGGTETFYITDTLYTTTSLSSLNVTQLAGTTWSESNTISNGASYAESTSYVSFSFRFEASATTMYAVFAPDYPDQNAYYVRNLKLYKVG